MSTDHFCQPHIRPLPGLLQSRNQATRQRLNHKKTLLSGNIADVEPIHEGEDRIIERRQCLRSRAGAYLAGILTQGDIAPPVKPIFNGPGVAYQFQQPCGRGVLGRETAEAIDDLGMCLAILDHRARQPKDLRDTHPLPTQKVIKLGRGDQFVGFQMLMSFVEGTRGAPIPAISRRLAKKEAQVVSQDGLVAKGDLALPAPDALAKRACWVCKASGCSECIL